MNLKRFLRGVDLDAIRDATQEAEQHTGSELVCVIVGRCDDYPAATWRGAAVGALAAVTVDAVLDVFGGGWSLQPAAWQIALVLAGLVAGGVLATWVPPLSRLLIDSDLMARRVSRRAAQAFIDEEIFATADRTGILLLVAVFERRVEIMADRGIAAMVDESVWSGIVDDLERGLKSAERGAVLEQAVRDLGTVLAEADVPRRDDDINELSDEPRVTDR